MGGPSITLPKIPFPGGAITGEPLTIQNGFNPILAALPNAGRDISRGLQGAFETVGGFTEGIKHGLFGIRGGENGPGPMSFADFKKNLETDASISPVTREQLLKQINDPTFNENDPAQLQAIYKAIYEARDKTNPNTIDRATKDKRIEILKDQPGVDAQTGGSASTLLSGYRAANNKTVLGG